MQHRNTSLKGLTFADQEKHFFLCGGVVVPKKSATLLLVVCFNLVPKHTKLILVPAALSPLSCTIVKYFFSIGYMLLTFL